MIDYFITIIDLRTASFEHGSLFTQLKGNDQLIKIFGPIYIDFDEYPPYSGRIYENFETNVNENIKYDYGYVYS